MDSFSFSFLSLIFEDKAQKCIKCCLTKKDCETDD